MDSSRKTYLKPKLSISKQILINPEIMSGIEMAEGLISVQEYLLVKNYHHNIFFRFVRVDNKLHFHDLYWVLELTNLLVGLNKEVTTFLIDNLELTKISNFITRFQIVSALNSEAWLQQLDPEVLNQLYEVDNYAHDDSLHNPLIIINLPPILNEAYTRENNLNLDIKTTARKILMRGMKKINSILGGKGVSLHRINPPEVHDYPNFYHVFEVKTDVES